MIPIEDALDLHAFHPRDIPVVVEEYLWEAAERGLREVRIIHGKGIGVQRRVVAGILDRHPAVRSHRVASGDRGHWGATIVNLRRIKRTASDRQETGGSSNQGEASPEGS
ncbi:MAG: DNA mismatch repair protein MutS [Candidatus Eisenbacteria bacterium]|nr:DNA mismatch repair protein MutS [Candidatus Eisenbacteria bacterium]